MRYAGPVRKILDIWSCGIAILGVLVTLGATMLSLVQKDWAMALLTVVVLGGMFGILYLLSSGVSRLLRNTLERIPVVHGKVDNRVPMNVIYHLFDNGDVLEETIY